VLGQLGLDDHGRPGFDPSARSGPRHGAIVEPQNPDHPRRLTPAPSRYRTRWQAPTRNPSLRRPLARPQRAGRQTARDRRQPRHDVPARPRAARCVRPIRGAEPPATGSPGHRSADDAAVAPHPCARLQPSAATRRPVPRPRCGARTGRCRQPIPAAASRHTARSRSRALFEDPHTAPSRTDCSNAATGMPPAQPSERRIPGGTGSLSREEPAAAENTGLPTFPGFRLVPDWLHLLRSET